MIYFSSNRRATATLQNELQHCSKQHQALLSSPRCCSSSSQIKKQERQDEVVKRGITVPSFNFLGKTNRFTAEGRKKTGRGPRNLVILRTTKKHPRKKTRPVFDLTLRGPGLIAFHLCPKEFRLVRREKRQQVGKKISFLSFCKVFVVKK